MTIEDGPAGIGVYGTIILDDSVVSILRGLHKLQGSGNATGVAFILDARGLIVNGHDGWCLPQGSAYGYILQGVALASLDSTEGIVF